jgi:hypothetical protein
MFEVVDPKHRLRPVVETSIRAAFRRDHGAQVGRLPRCLVADIDGARVTCAASLRFAEDGFFSERYLDEPIERLIALHAGASFDRTDVVEVGSLGAVQPGKVRDLVRGIITFLQARDMHWAFFTATARLRIFLRRAGLPLIDLAPADPARIETAEMWGSYYQQIPKVMLVGDSMLPGVAPPIITLGERVIHA